MLVGFRATTVCAEISAVALQELGYRVKRWTVDDGLPTGFLFSVVQTPDGYLWVSSIRGVSRFDGITFMNFENPDPDRPIFLRPKVSVDEDGGLWVVSLGGEVGVLLRYEDGGFQRLGQAEGGLPPRKWTRYAQRF